MEITPKTIDVGWAKNHIEEVVLAVVKKVKTLEIDDDIQITEKTKLYDDLNIDSLEVVEIAMNLEEAFDLDVLDEFILKCQTVEDLINGIKRVV